MSPTQEAAMKMALEALEVAAVSYPVNRHKAALALRAALAERQEPVACEWPSCGCRVDLGEDWKACHPEVALPQRKPLSEEEIMQCFDEAVADYVDVSDAEMVDFARAVERAHGIKRQE